MAVTVAGLAADGNHCGALNELLDNNKGWCACHAPHLKYVLISHMGVVTTASDRGMPLFHIYRSCLVTACCSLQTVSAQVHSSLCYSLFPVAYRKRHDRQQVSFSCRRRCIVVLITHGGHCCCCNHLKCRDVIVPDEIVNTLSTT